MIFNIKTKVFNVLKGVIISFFRCIKIINNENIKHKMLLGAFYYESV